MTTRIGPCYCGACVREANASEAVYPRCYCRECESEGKHNDDSCLYASPVSFAERHGADADTADEFYTVAWPYGVEHFAPTAREWRRFMASKGVKVYAPDPAQLALAI